MSPLWRVNTWIVRVSCAQGAVGKKPIRGPMQIVGSATGNSVHNAARSSTIFRRTACRNNLEFLNSVLRNIVCTGATSIFTVPLIGGIVAIGKEGVAPWIAAECEQAERTIKCSARRIHYKTIYTATVDRQFQKLAAANHHGNICLCAFYQRRFCVHFHVSDG